MRVTRTTKTLSRTIESDDATFGPTLTMQEGFRIKSGPRYAKCYTPSLFNSFSHYLYFSLPSLFLRERGYMLDSSFRIKIRFAFDIVINS
jgi:hypothetical protein